VTRFLLKVLGSWVVGVSTLALIGSCGAPVSTQPQVVSPSPTATATATAKPTVKPTPTAKPTVKPSTKPTVKPSPVEVFYANCREVRRAGKAPLRSGDPGYSSSLDRDDDGVACES
jgi:hypothetical protein